MADRFPLIVNSVSQKIEELVSGDNLDLSGNNIVISGDTGSGKYLTSDGSVVSWGTPGDVYLNASQTLTNKTFESCVLSGSNNTLSNIPNTALVNQVSQSTDLLLLLVEQLLHLITTQPIVFLL